MKIIFFVYSIYGMGGTVRATVNTANYLVTQGHTVEIISMRRTHDNSLFDIDYNVKLSWLLDARQGGSFLKKCFRKLVSYFPSRLVDPTEDLYKHFNLFVDWMLIQKMKKITEGVVITTIPSFNMAQIKYVGKNVIKIGQEHKDFSVHDVRLQEKIKATYSGLDAVVCLTEKEEQRYRRFLSGDVKIARIANVTQGSYAQTDLTHQTIISAGRFEYEKGYDLLIEAFETIAPHFPTWRLKLFGRGFEEGRLREMVKAKNLEEQVSIQPISKDVQYEMSQASLYVLSSRSEAFGLTIVEAMEVGLPVVSFSCIGPSEIIDHEKDGLLVEEGNIEALASAMSRMISSKERLADYSINAREKARKYSSDIMGKKWNKLLTDLSR
ncbi:MAG: glycosyltransferase family 4 protein [Defluviitaleaceae bacterium]|nr:glycosyltransferase family 4 protein [Defluviitaleaceae bacterium]